MLYTAKTRGCGSAEN